ncbi:MFS transporter [Streptomyces sp. O3]
MRSYLATAFCARLADEGVAVAVALLALERTGSAAQSGFVLAAWLAPHLLAAPLTGGLAARVRWPRLWYAAALGGFGAAIAGLALTVGRGPVGLALAVALAGGCCGPVVSGGLSSLVASLAPDEEARARAYAWDAATYNAASVVGPAGVALASAALSPGAATLLLAGAAAGAAGLVWLLPLRAGPAAVARSLRADLTAGLAAVWRIPALRAITASTCVAYVGVGGLTVTAALLAEERGRAGGAGVLVTAFALGALGGCLAVARRPPRGSARRLARWSLLGTGAALAGAAAAPYELAVVLFGVAGLCDGPLLTATLRIRAAYAPQEVRAQVFTLGAGLKLSAAAGGAALVGVGAGAALPAYALLLVVAALQLAAAALLRGRSEG